MSLRARLTAAYTLFFALALLLLGVALYAAVRQLLLQSVENELRVSSALIENAYANRNLELGDTAVFDVVRARSLLLRVIDLNRQVRVESPTLRSDDLPFTEQQIRVLLAGQDVPPVVQTLDGTPVLTLLRPLRVGPRLIGVVQVAQPLQTVEQALRALAWALAGGGVLVLLAAAQGGLWLTRAALRPIDDVSATAARIVNAEDLGQRVPTVAADDELGRLTRTVNEMLERMERTFAVQQRFTADVAHELRTPLAAMRGNLEILRRGAQHDPALLDESLRDIESEVLRLTRMANDLLVLAQADTGVALRPSLFQLDEVMLEVYRELRALANGVQLHVDLHDQVALHGDRDRIKQALLNLVANALQHTPAGGTVTLRLERTPTHAVLTVADTGSGIPVEQQPFIFDRFYRGDAARARSGAGLGLSIVQWVAEAHGGRASVESQAGRGATFRLELPLTPAGAEQLQRSDSAHTTTTHAPVSVDSDIRPSA